MSVQQVISPAPASTVVPIANSLVAAGSAAAPGAGASFVSPGTPPAGLYQVTVIYSITGAVEAAPQNVRYSANGGSISINLPSGGGITDIYTFVIPRLQLNGSNQAFLLAIAAATVSTVYTGVVVHQQIG